MKARDLAELLLLAALWGASFIFMRLGAGEFGAVALAFVRVALAAVVLLLWLRIHGSFAALRAHWRAITVVGVLNTAIPFTLFNFAALHINAGLSAIFNATSPLWAALVAWVWLSDKPSALRALGLGLGFAGVLWLGWDKAGFKPGAPITDATLAVAACLAGTLCYGTAIHYTKRRLTGVPPLAVAAGSQTAAAVALAAPALWLWPAQPPTPMAWLWAALLALLCTALAYLIYFRLIARLGPTRAISVTFVIPLFGVLWGAVFIGESVTPVMVAAGAVILLGTALAAGLIHPVAWARHRR